MTAEGQVYIWGTSEFAKLGVHSMKKLVLPVCIKDLSAIKKISLGNYHASAIDSNGKLYTWGRGSNG